MKAPAIRFYQTGSFAVGNRLLDPEQRPAQIAHHGLHACRRRASGEDAPTLDQIVETSPRALAHEHVDLALAILQQPFDETAADEARCSCHEVGHRAEPTSNACGRVGRVRRGSRGALGAVVSGPGARSAASLSRRETCGTAGTVGEHLGARGSLHRERLAELHAEPLDRRAAIGEHRALREACQALGERERHRSIWVVAR